MTVFSQ